MASYVDQDISNCQVCQAILKGDLDEASTIIDSSKQTLDKCTFAVYLLIKYYLQHLTDISQSGEPSLSTLWNSEEVQNIRKSVTNLLKTLFKMGLTANTCHEEETPLLCAVSTHDVDLVQTLLENGADANMMTPVNKMNAVALAIILNDAVIVKLLLSHGAKVNEACCQRLTPLQLSMNKSVSKVLLQNGADVQQVIQMVGHNEIFITSPPLIHAVQTDNIFLAAILLEHGEDLNQSYGECTNSALHFAILGNNNDMIKLLIQYGANLNKRNGRGHTPLGLALHLCKDQTLKEIANTLLTAGCSRTKGSVIEVFQRHFPPLHIAAFLGTEQHLNIIKQLIQMSSYVESDTNDLDSPTTNSNSACKTFDDTLSKSDGIYRQALNNSERLTNLIVAEQQEFINTQAMDKSTALYMAVLGNNIAVAKYLCQQGADPYLTCWHGSLLHAAVMASKKGTELMKFVLQFNFDINLLNDVGNTCLILAARNDTANVCELIIQHGALLNVRDGRCGETALSASVYFGLEDNVATLLRCGADPDMPDSRDTNALYWAIFNCRERSLELLLQSGAKLTASDLATYPKNIKVMRNPYLKGLLHNYTKEPHSLQHCSRYAIRKQLMQVHCGKSIMTSVKALPLPPRLKSYIALN